MRSTYSRVVCYEWECVVNIVSVSLVVVVVILFLILTRRRERENDRFPFRPFLPFAFWRKRTIFFFGMKRCALTYAFDGMQPNENIQFQLFALRETDGHILPMYESEYKQHIHTHTQMSIVCDSLSMYECYMRTIKCNTYFFGFG